MRTGFNSTKGRPVAPQPDPFSDPDLPHRYLDKIALVTGSAQGIGRATALRLGAEGAAV
jgi:hypothetical protein